uniref:Uncharacterized protein n=1 Tax=Setaria viridis TaxID=4556 RepID=A0A4U6UP53_SETVI|nr:hypothetical protein SEVIR_5G337766v2 [Setaria viridis]
MRAMRESGRARRRGADEDGRRTEGGRKEQDLDRELVGEEGAQVPKCCLMYRQIFDYNLTSVMSE